MVEQIQEKLKSCEKEFDRRSYLKEIIEEFVDQLEEYGLINDEDKAKQIIFSEANVILLDQIQEFKALGEKIGVKELFCLRDGEIKAISLVNSLNECANKLTRTSKISFEKNTKKEMTNYSEEQIIKTLDNLHLLLLEVEKFISNLNRLDMLEQTILYHRYLKLRTESIPKITIKYIKGYSQSTVYRIRENAVVTLVSNL